MAIHSIVPFTEATDAGRWDAEFYQPYFRELGRRLSATCMERISDVASLCTTAFDPSAVKEFHYAEISRVDTGCGAIDTVTVRREDTPDRAKHLLCGGEVLVSTVRPNRSLVALVPHGVKDWVATSGFAALLAKDNRYRAALFAWVKTRAITDWLDRHTTASMYPAVSVDDVLRTPFPKMSDSVLDNVAALVKEMEVLRENGRKAYPEAESELLDRIGWFDLAAKPTELFYVEDFKTLAKHQRIDAEHFQPMCKRLCERLSDLGAEAIGDFCPEPRRGVQPEFCEKGDVAVIDSKAVRPHGVEPNKAEATSMKFYNSPFAGKGHVVRGDVLLNSTGLGTLGRASFYDSDAPGLADNHVAIIHPDLKACVPAYLSLFLNSPAGRAQSEMFQTGSSGQLEIYPQHIKAMLVYLPKTKMGKTDLVWQQKLADKVLGAARARVEARIKLEEAKKLVEATVVG